LQDHETSEPYRLGLAMWVIAGEGEILASRVAVTESGASILLEMLLQAMRDPEVGKPRRPGTVRARDPELLRLLHDTLMPLGVAVEQVVVHQHRPTSDLFRRVGRRRRVGLRGGRSTTPRGERERDEGDHH